MFIAIFNFAFLILSVFVAESITGEEVISASIGKYNDIDESVMFTENEEVTFYAFQRRKLPKQNC